MALNWNCEKVADYEALHTDNVEWVKTQALAFALLGAGLGRVTADNYKQVFERVSLWERLFGASVVSAGEDAYFTLEDIKRRVGYSTNISDDSDDKWLKSVFRIWKD